jgi:hypothetical protein
MWSLALTIAIGSLVWAGISYPSLAASNGWPVGAWAQSDNWSAYHIVGMLAVLWSGWNFGGLIGIVSVFILSWILAFLLTLVLKRKTQIVALLSLPIGLPWWIASFWLA